MLLTGSSIPVKLGAVNVPHPRRMAPATFRRSLALLAMILAACLPAAAQLAPSEPDPLARIRDAAKDNVVACSATGETLCEQVAPKIIANAQGDSPLAENLRRIRENLNGVSGSDAAKRVVDWSVAAFQNAGLDAHVERYASPNDGSSQSENVSAEVRGREKPDEWVLVGASLSTWANGPGTSDYNCDAAMVIEAARDIVRTGVHPRRSIRFVLFSATNQGARAYVHSHENELDRARGVIVFNTGCTQMTGYSLNGRRDIEARLREAMKPAQSLGADRLVSNAWFETDAFDFLLQGVPTLTGYHAPAVYALDSLPAGIAPEGINVDDLKNNTADVAVVAFGIAERSEPLGPRQSRREIEALLKASGLEGQMKTAGLWPLWESGERGRLPGTGK